MSRFYLRVARAFPRHLDGLAADPGYARRYGEFQRLMVYGSELEYAACIGPLRNLAEGVSAF
jgi:hypothetical protein